MKRYFYLLVLPLIVGAVMLSVGCSSDDDDANVNNAVVTPLESGDDTSLSDFFKEALPEHGTYSTVFFTTCQLSDTCCLINSREDFQRLYTGTDELPEVDFSKNSLIIGTSYETAGYLLDRVTVEVGFDAITETLCFKQLEGAFDAAFFPYYRWGLYPKLPNKKIVTKKVYTRISETK